MSWKEKGNGPWDIAGRAVCTFETNKAIKVLIHRDGEASGEVWVPHSVIHDDSEVFGSGHKGQLIVKAWWGEKNDI